MGKYKIEYGIGGGYNIEEEEIIECNSLEEAEEIAFEQACEMYESYEPVSWSDIEDNPEDYGIDDIEEMSEEEKEECIQDVYNEVRESWINYSAAEITE